MSFLKKLRQIGKQRKNQNWKVRFESKDVGCSRSIGHDDTAQVNTAPETVFELKYHGSRLVESANNKNETAEAIRSVRSMAKASNRKPPSVALAISLQGIRMTDLDTEQEQFQVSMHRILQCPVDGQTFAFVTINLNENMECHVFACPKQKIAQDVYRALGQALEVSHELWQMDHADSKMYHTNENTDRLQFVFHDFPGDSYDQSVDRQAVTKTKESIYSNVIMEYKKHYLVNASNDFTTSTYV